jgi:hypothetical protein
VRCPLPPGSCRTRDANSIGHQPDAGKPAHRGAALEEPMHSIFMPGPVSLTGRKEHNDAANVPDDPRLVLDGRSGARAASCPDAQFTMPRSVTTEFRPQSPCDFTYGLRRHRQSCHFPARGRLASALRVPTSTMAYSAIVGHQVAHRTILDRAVLASPPSPPPDPELPRTPKPTRGVDTAERGLCGRPLAFRVGKGHLPGAPRGQMPSGGDGLVM